MTGRALLVFVNFTNTGSPVEHTRRWSRMDAEFEASTRITI
jgi:hypothetical protein